MMKKGKPKKKITEPPTLANVTSKAVLKTITNCFVTNPSIEYCSGEIKMDPAVLFVKNFSDNPVSLPISPDVATELSKIGTIGTVGVETIDSINKDVRDSTIFKANEFSFTLHPGNLGILNEIQKNLLPSYSTSLFSVLAKEYKLNIYSQGDHFAVHQDSPRPGLVGSLVLCLPSQFEGGEFVLYNDSNKNNNTDENNNNNNNNDGESSNSTKRKADNSSLDTKPPPKKKGKAKGTSKGKGKNKGKEKEKEEETKEKEKNEQESVQVVSKSTCSSILLDWSKKSSEPDLIQWVAFFSELPHEVLTVKSGFRITVTYHIYCVPRTDIIGTPNIRTDLTNEPLYNIFEDSLRNPEFFPKGKKIAFGLTHQYPLVNDPETKTATTEIPQFVEKNSDANLSDTQFKKLNQFLKYNQEVYEHDFPNRKMSKHEYPHNPVNNTPPQIALKGRDKVLWDILHQLNCRVSLQAIYKDDLVFDICMDCDEDIEDEKPCSCLKRGLNLIERGEKSFYIGNQFLHVGGSVKEDTKNGYLDERLGDRISGDTEAFIMNDIVWCTLPGSKSFGNYSLFASNLGYGEAFIDTNYVFAALIVDIPSYAKRKSGELKDN